MAQGSTSEMQMETLLERLKKIEAPAIGGSEGERANAQRLLGMLCAKYGVTLSQIADQKKSWHAFSVRGERERELFCSVLVHVMQTRQIRHMKSASGYECELTVAQALDVQDCWTHFRAAWREQLSDFFTAFIHKNRIFGPPSDDNEDLDEETRARAKRIFDLMHGMESRPRENRLRILAEG